MAPGIPFELLVMMAGYLSKPDLKSFRLAPHEFRDIAELFPIHTDVWFSPYPEDQEAFTAIYQSPGLAKHVTSIILDTTFFGKSLVWNEDKLRDDMNFDSPNLKWKDPEELDESVWGSNYDDSIELHERKSESQDFTNCQRDLLSKLKIDMKKLPNVQSLRLHCGFYRWAHRNKLPSKLE